MLRCRPAPLDRLRLGGHRNGLWCRPSPQGDRVQEVRVAAGHGCHALPGPGNPDGRDATRRQCRIVVQPLCHRRGGRPPGAATGKSPRSPGHRAHARGPRIQLFAGFGAGQSRQPGRLRPGLLRSGIPPLREPRTPSHSPCAPAPGFWPTAWLVRPAIGAVPSAATPPAISSPAIALAMCRRSWHRCRQAPRPTPAHSRWRRLRCSAPPGQRRLRGAMAQRRRRQRAPCVAASRMWAWTPDPLRTTRRCSRTRNPRPRETRPRRLLFLLSCPPSPHWPRRMRMLPSSSEEPPPFHPQVGYLHSCQPPKDSTNERTQPHRSSHQ